MTGEERRNRILKMIQSSDQPISGSWLANEMDVSRQVIVQDIALIRANGIDILSTNKGYVIQENNANTRVLKMNHTIDDVENELNLVVDNGGRVEDVFIYHRVFGVVKAELHIRSRKDVRTFMENLRSSSSTLLSTATNGYHYHTIVAETKEELDEIEKRLAVRGFLAPRTEYEPKEMM